MKNTIWTNRANIRTKHDKGIRLLDWLFKTATIYVLRTKMDSTGRISGQYKQIDGNLPKKNIKEMLEIKRIIKEIKNAFGSFF